MDRDVQLVIRATDQASRATNAVADALRVLRRTQDDVVRSSERSGSTLERFGNAISEIQRTIRSQNVGDRLESELEKASRAVERLENSLGQTEQEYNRFGAAAIESALNVERQQQASQQLQAQLERERASLRQLRRERTAANNAVAQAGGAASPEQLATQAQAEQAVIRQERAIEQLTSQLRRQNDATKDAIRENTRLAQSAEQAGRDLLQQASAVEAARENFMSLAAEAGQAEQALEQLGRSATRELRLAVGAQARVVREAEASFRASQPGVAVAAQEFREASAAADQYAETLGEGSREAREARAEANRLEESFNLQRQISATLRQEYRQQQAALGALRNISRETATDTQEITERQARFVAELDRAQQSTQRSQGVISSYNARLSQLTAQSQRSANSTRQHAGAQRDLATAMGRANTAGNQQVGVLRRLFGEGRRALSITQRLRGQVLALATQYVGFFAVAQGFSNVIDDVQKLEGVTNGLNAVFQGDGQVVNEQLDFLRRNANRLGIQFTDLATQYTRFAAATRNTPIEDSAEGIFLRVAEAGRVLNLSGEELNGTLVALSQIASIGTIQSEELRQQLGDRLPGAVQLLADGLNVTTEELFKMIDAGEVSSQALINFVDQLEQRFGGGLEGSLTSLNAELARLGNTAQQANLQFAEAGFSDAVTEAARDIREVLESAEFEDLITNLSQIASGAIGVLVDVFENLRLVIVAVTAAFALRLAPGIQRAAENLNNFVGRVRTSTRATLQNATATNTAAVATTRFGRAMQVGAAFVRNFAAQLRGLLASTGVGLLFVGISTALSLLATRTRESTAAFNTHRRIVDQVRDAHQTAAGNTAIFAERMSQLGDAALRQNVGELSDITDDLVTSLQRAAIISRQSIIGSGGSRGRASSTLRETSQELAELIAQFGAGEITLNEFNEQTDSLAENFRGPAREVEFLTDRIGTLQRRIVESEDDNRSLSESVQALTAAQAALELASGKTIDQLTEQQRAALELSNITGELGDKFDQNKRQSQGLAAALDEIGQGIPAIAAETKRLEELKTLGEILEAEGLPPTIEELTAQLATMRATLAAIGEDNVFGRFLQGGIDNLETVIERVQARIDAINNPSSGRSRRRDPFADAIERVNESLANDRRGLQTDALRAENNELEAVLIERRAFIENLISDDFTAEQQARLRELGESYVDFGRMIVQAEEVEQAKEALETLQEAVNEVNLERLQAETSDTVAGRAEAFAIELAEEVRRLEEAAREAGVDPEDIARATNELRAHRQVLFDIAELERQADERQERAQAAEQRINTLLTTRRSLVSQLNTARDAGQVDNAAQIEQEIAALDATILSARDNAIKLIMELAGRGEISGEEARASIAGINDSVRELVSTTEEAILTKRQFGELVTNNLSNAFSQFAENIANGENVLSSLGNAFRQFASQTLIEIGRIIARAVIMQAIFSALGIPAVGGGTGGSLFGNVLSGVFHGGRQGNGAPGVQRSVSAAAFVGAPRFHEGRVGLSSGEMAAIIRRDEDVLTADNPFNSANLGQTVRGLMNAGGNSAPQDVKIVNAIDSADMLEAALAENAGQRVIMNFIRRNRSEINSSLG